MKQNSNITEKMVFCDFDGTITEKDAFVSVCKTFAPEAVDTYLTPVMTGDITLREGITRILETISSEAYPKMLASVEGAVIRPGLNALLDFLDRQGIPFVIISGGLKGLVLKQLSEFAGRAHGIHAADVDTAGEKLKVVSPFQAGSELVAKIKVMETYTFNESIAIGDGITDYSMAKKAGTVFARGHLAKHLDESGAFYYPYQNFYDVKAQLVRLWGI